MRKEFAFEEVIVVTVGSTRVPRVQFGVPPNCHGARGLAVCHPHTCSVCAPLVSGVTPETTRQRRVLHTDCGRSR
jgi:hypothetical protein